MTQTAYFNQTTSLSTSGRIQLFEIDGNDFGAGIHRFHYSPVPHTPAEILAAGDDETKLTPKPIIFAGQTYDFWPIEITDLAMSTEQANQPNLYISNLSGYVTAWCLQFNDMINAKVKIIDTFVDYLDAANFAGGNPTADPTAYSYQNYWIDTKTSEDDEVVTWSLSSPADLQGQMIPTRIITSLCTWALRGQYRSGDGCTYNGNAYFDVNGNPVSDPALDECGGCYSDCYKRFGAGMANPKAADLDFGGFLAANLVNK